MLGAGFRLVTSLTVSCAELALDSGRTILGDDFIDIRPRQFRRLLLAMEDSIQGRIPEILGDDDEERIQTLVRLLRGTSEQDMVILINDLQAALARLDEERRRDDRRRARR